MPKYVDCPYCGDRGERTNEHVWAQWLHELPAAKQLLADTHGERIPRPSARTRLGADGRYESFDDPDGQVAKWLPNVKVPVCAKCNNGWMSQLEDRAKAILGPYFQTGRPVALGKSDLRTLAAWAMKSWMAYALSRGEERNPFTRDEYRQMAQRQAPPDRSAIWLLNSHSPYAQVGLGFESLLTTPRGELPDLAAAPDNTGFGFLSASTVVMFMALPPPHKGEEYIDIVMTPKGVKDCGSRRIWPSLRPQYYPLEAAPHALIQSLKDFPSELMHALGLPVHGLTPEDASSVLDQFYAGADPATLRDEWGVEFHAHGESQSLPDP